MTKRFGSLTVAALLCLSVVSAVSAAGTPGSARAQQPVTQSGYQFWRTHGYLPVDGVDSFYRQKAAAAARVAAGDARVAAPGESGAAPIIGASWQGVNTVGLTPPDPNGAIGPNSYIET